MKTNDAGMQCAECGHWTEKGREMLALKSRQNPIYGTDFSKPLSMLVEDLRGGMATLRGRLDDISHAYPGWGDRLKDVEGLLTCGLIALHLVVDEMRKCEKIQRDEAAKKAAGAA